MVWNGFRDCKPIIYFLRFGFEVSFCFFKNKYLEIFTLLLILLKQD